MGPLIVPLISLGAQLLQKAQQEHEMKKQLPLQAAMRAAQSWGANTNAAQTQSQANNIDLQSQNNMNLAPTIASLVGAMGQSPVDPSSIDSAHNMDSAIKQGGNDLLQNPKVDWSSDIEMPFDQQKDPLEDLYRKGGLWA